ncbi:hypothetical protein ACRAWG_05750 [Methylobacterium sp. P31]
MLLTSSTPANAGEGTVAPAGEIDTVTLRAVVARRLARLTGQSLPVASTIAQLNGLGPKDERR